MPPLLKSNRRWQDFRAVSKVRIADNTPQNPYSTQAAQKKYLPNKIPQFKAKKVFQLSPSIEIPSNPPVTTGAVIEFH